MGSAEGSILGQRTAALLLALALLAAMQAQAPGRGAREGRSKARPTAEAPRLDPARLRPPLEDPEVRLALALSLASGGALSRAIAELDAAAETDGRLGRERARLAQLSEAREAWLAGVAQRGGKLKVELEGVMVQAKLESYAGGVLTFSRGKRESQVPVEAIPIATLFFQVKDLPAKSPGWLVPYALALGGEQGWDASLAADDPEADALRADGSEFPRLLHIGRAVADLAALGALELSPEGQLAAERAPEAVERITRLMAGSGELKLVDDRRADLRELARLAQAALYDAKPGLLPLSGAAEWLEGGVLRLRYEFERAEEVEDFTLDTAYLPDWHASMLPVSKPPAESYFVMKQGAFFGDGQLVYRHALGFGPGVRVAYEMRYVPRPGDPLDVGVVMIGLADDGQGSFAAASEFGDVYAVDLESLYNKRKLYEGERTLRINTIYECEARLAPAEEGCRIEAWREGQQRNELPAGGRTRGGVFLFVHSPRIVAIESLSIEGVPEPESLAALRQRWIEARLVEMGAY